MLLTSLELEYSYDNNSNDYDYDYNYFVDDSKENSLSESTPSQNISPETNSIQEDITNY